jgi:methylthioribose-1-phosphate isomerase
MKSTRAFIAAAAALVVLSIRPAIAHHSFSAAFDATKPVLVTGVITEVRLVNPHSQFVEVHSSIQAGRDVAVRGKHAVLVDSKRLQAGNVEGW